MHFPYCKFSQDDTWGCANCLELGIFPHLVAEESWTLPLNRSLGNSFEQLDQLARVCINKFGYGTLDKPTSSLKMFEEPS